MSEKPNPLKIDDAGQTLDAEIRQLIEDIKTRYRGNGSVVIQIRGGRVSRVGIGEAWAWSWQTGSAREDAGPP